MRLSLVSVFSLALGLLLAAPGPAQAAPDVRVLHHDVRVALSPKRHALDATDTISFPTGWKAYLTEGATDLRMRLHAGLAVEADDASHFDVVALEMPASKGGSASGEEGAGHSLQVRTWLLRPRAGAPDEGARARLHIKGTIHHPLKAEGVEYARSFSRTPGTIDERGVFLGGASWWLPRIADELVTFDLTVDLPEGWDAVSQGKRSAHGVTAGRRIVTWTCAHPMDEAYIIANRFTEYSRSTGNLTAYAFLREPDPNLANKYLEVTAQYVDMYRRLIGRYPFAKFALVENFWETGYGMPSFTLLGPKVIRFPFILHSSYPHEILHNWWGNSVYVDWETGNWCEGLTAYLADHLVREGQGRGVEYRRDTLKGYRNYVNEGKDFPLTQFRSRHSSATQAVGYGKCLMLFHMLRVELGDALFKRGLQRFYRTQQFKRASFADIAAVFSETAERDLTVFFDQWVKREGAPELVLTRERTAEGDKRFILKQVQEGDAFELLVPVEITFEGDREPLFQSVRMKSKEVALDLPAEGSPVRIDVDPEYDVFRRLDRDEIPPTLSGMFGAQDVTIVVPDAGSDPLAAGWRAVAESWTRGRGGKVQIVDEAALKGLPKDRAVWVFGSHNTAARYLRPALGVEAAGLRDGKLRFGIEGVPQAGHSFVYVARHPANPDVSIAWAGSDTEAALPGLARKLPHYGKYSYLAFTGAAPDNVVKGTWQAAGKRLAVTTTPAYGVIGRSGVQPRGKLPARTPLERLAPVFDPKQLMRHVAWLADDAREGRGVGTQGLDASADYIAAAFKEAGLKPGGDDGTFFQHFAVGNGPDGKSVTLKNVVAVLPGTNPALKGQSVVLGAHYDHLGRGWPDVRAGEQGKIHNGADDNASGIAVMLEVAGLLGKQLEPARSVVFVAFSGEEWGLKGSTHYVRHESIHPAKKALAMVNLDTVGRLDGKKILVLGSGTASEWRHIAMGVGFTTGVESKCVADDPGGSDQVSFHRVGVPAVQLFSGGHADYHRSTDDVEKVDVDGLVRVATFVRETIAYLSAREQPLTSSLVAGARPAPAAGSGSARKVSFGTMPAFDFPGPGVKVGAVMEGSPAAKAGVRKGDILVAIDGTALTGLRAFSDALKAHAPGDVVKVKLRRGEKDVELEVTLAAR